MNFLKKKLKKSMGIEFSPRIYALFCCSFDLLRVYVVHQVKRQTIEIFFYFYRSITCIKENRSLVAMIK